MISSFVKRQSIGLRAATLVLLAAILVALAIWARPTLFSSKRRVVGLIVKTENNPFFLAMEEGAASSSKLIGFDLMTASGKQDGDFQSQIEAIETMTRAGVLGILIAPSNAKAVAPALQHARDAGILVIALDSPVDPSSAADALFATDNYEAGKLIGIYAKAALRGAPPKVVTLDLFPGQPVGAQRHNGFISGLGYPALGASSNELSTGEEIVCMADSYGDERKGQLAMEKCIQKGTAFNVVYAINEVAAAGAHAALKQAGRDKDVMVVSIDGGCAGVRDTKAGTIAATAQQYPRNMAILGIDAIHQYVTTGKRPESVVNTGVTLITEHPMPGVDSRDSFFGSQACWG